MPFAPDLYIWQGRPSGGGRETLWTGQDPLLLFKRIPKKQLFKFMSKRQGIDIVVNDSRNFKSAVP
jgi:hypothetical protein